MNLINHNYCPNITGNARKYGIQNSQRVQIKYVPGGTILAKVVLGKLILGGPFLP